ncbi:MAG: hypothetical protein AAB880_01450 [Patescibacteria group bacterium]
MFSPLERSILAALVYFDIFEYPLTLLEIQRYFLPAENQGDKKQYTLGEIRGALNSSVVLAKVARFKNGYYYLRGKDGNLRNRADKYFYSAAKYRRARKVARLLSYMPFVRLIAVCNSLSISAAGKGSDIDLFIVARARGVWWARLFSLLVLKLLRLRPGQNGVRDKICLSFFVDDEHLNLAPVRAGEEDIYFAYWLGALYPLYEAGDWYGQLWRANDWLRQILPGARPVLPLALRHFTRVPFFKLAAEAGLAPLAPLAAWVQRAIFPAAIKNMANLDSRVRIESGLLKFHTNDRRADYNQEFFNRLKAISS